MKTNGSLMYRRCPVCKKRRKYADEHWDTNHGGETHVRRPHWGLVDDGSQNGRLICGWCFYRLNPNKSTASKEFKEIMEKALSQNCELKLPDGWKFY